MLRAQHNAMNLEETSGGGQLGAGLEETRELKRTRRRKVVAAIRRVRVRVRVRVREGRHSDKEAAGATGERVPWIVVLELG